MKCIMCGANMKPRVAPDDIKYCPKCNCIVGSKGTFYGRPKKPLPPPPPPSTVKSINDFNEYMSNLNKGTDRPKEVKGKYQPHLVCASLTRAVARVREYGVLKYHGEDGWKQQTAMDYMDAIGRHYDECRNNPISRDTESGLLHIAQIATNAMFIIQMLSEQGTDLDDMNKPEEKK